MPNIIKHIRVALGALEAERTRIPIAEHRLCEIEEARQLLSMTKGADVIDAVDNLLRSGLSPRIDLREQTRIDPKDTDERTTQRRMPASFA